jgi:hypothetical protein
MGMGTVTGGEAPAGAAETLAGAVDPAGVVDPNGAVETLAGAVTLAWAVVLPGLAEAREEIGTWLSTDLVARFARMSSHWVCNVASPAADLTSDRTLSTASVPATNSTFSLSAVTATVVSPRTTGMIRVCPLFLK